MSLSLTNAVMGGNSAIHSKRQGREIILKAWLSGYIIQKGQADLEPQQI